MNISANGVNFIKKWEGGPWLTAKRFGSEKYLSIGYGHYGPDVKMGQTITKAQAEELLMKDIAGAVNHVNTVNIRYGYIFNQNEFDALVSFSYNIGSINQLTANGTRSKAVIANKILQYNKSGGKVLPGLTNRRKAEHELFLKKSSQGVKYMIEVSTISKGSTGPRVAVIQSVFRAEGIKYNGKLIAVDGNAGPATSYAIKTWQKSHGQKTDGYFGPACWAYLMRD